MHVFEALGQKQGPGACQDVPVGSEQASGSVHHLSGRIVGVISHWVYTEVLRPVLGKDRIWRCLWNLVVAIGKDVLITCHRGHSKCKTASVWGIFKGSPPATHAWHNYKVHNLFTACVIYTETITFQEVSSGDSGNVYCTVPMI